MLTTRSALTSRIPAALTSLSASPFPAAESEVIDLVAAVALSLAALALLLALKAFSRAKQLKKAKRLQATWYWYSCFASLSPLSSDVSCRAAAPSASALDEASATPVFSTWPGEVVVHPEVCYS